MENEQDLQWWETRATDEEIMRAREAYGSEDIEIDDDARASRPDDGVWVSAWVWRQRIKDNA